MRALRLHGPGDLRLEDAELRAPIAGEVVVDVDACGVCGSDLHFLDGTARTDHVPITIGHEVAGRVADSADPDWPTGTPVLVAVGTFCEACPRCLEGRHNICERAQVLGIDVDGGLADALVAPTRSLVALPNGVDVAEAATAVDAGTTAFHAVTRTGAVRAGDAVAIIGGGGLGTYGLQFARFAGATPIIVADTNQSTLERAHGLGADETVLVEEGMSVGRAIKMLTDGGADVAIEFVGRASTVDAAVKSIRPGGTAVAVGVGNEPLVTLPPVLWSNHEYSLRGSYGALPGDLATVVGLMASGDIAAPPVVPVALEDAADRIVALSRGDIDIGGRMVVSP